jgi:hypothetical protein
MARAQALAVADIERCTSVLPFGDVVGTHPVLRCRSLTANAMLDPLTAMTGTGEHGIAPGAMVTGEQFSVGGLHGRTRGAQVEDW